MKHDILHPLPGLADCWHEATALRYHAPAYAAEFRGQTLLFSRRTWEPVYWGPDPADFLRTFRLPPPSRPQSTVHSLVDLDMADLLKDLI
jgi:hypothetical protein